MAIVACIFARGGSKGVPGKNIRLLGGKPLIAWSIEHALAVSRIQRVIVSTDSEEIAAVARQYGAETPFIRPPDLAADHSPEWLAWRHALEYFAGTGGLPNAMVSVPATSPLRSPLDIERCLDKYEEGQSDIVITVSEAKRSPYFNMVKLDVDGNAGLVIPPAAAISRRQDVPVVYDIATVAYVCRPAFILQHQSLFEGRVQAVPVPAERAVDIDTELDFIIAESLMLAKGESL